MVLRALDPAPKEALGNGWEIIAQEAGRSPHGLRATVTLFNGRAHACQTLALGDPTAQQTLAATYAALVERTVPEVTTALIKLVVAIEGTLREMDAAGEVGGQSQATILVALATHAGVTLFHTPEGDAYATIEVGSHRETWPLKVKGFRRWLARLFYTEYDKTPGSQALQDALGVLEGRALYDGPECPVYTRLAQHDGAMYLDLGNAVWQAVEITPSGWRVVDTLPVKFRRPRGMLPLPEPVRGGTLDALRPFVNLANADDWRLVVSWLLAALRPSGPYPVLVIYGEQGSAKSSLVRVLRALVDPNAAALRATSRDERDLVIAATNGWVVALDNLSHLPDWLSDALCRLATGSGFATRELYTDSDEAIFAAQRPIVLNGIEELATRGDLLDRAILLYLPPLPEERRQDEAAFWSAFDQSRPAILGALLDIVSAALQRLPTTALRRKPRMADFALWSCAAAEACGWTPQDFLDAYQGVRAAVHELTLDASPVGPLIRDYVTQCSPWEGTASELLTALEARAHGGAALNVGSDVTKHKTWPKNGRALSNTLRRLAPTLRAVGIDVQHTREPHTGKRVIAVTRSVTQTPDAGGTPPSAGRVQGAI